jgi:hypothetical protein
LRSEIILLTSPNINFFLNTTTEEVITKYKNISS